jgi:hypothetical protein
MASVLSLLFGSPVANTLPGIKAAAAVSADPLIARFKNCLREVILAFFLLSVARCSSAKESTPQSRVASGS